VGVDLGVGHDDPAEVARPVGGAYHDVHIVFASVSLEQLF
jgi:hypothetical protein